MDEPKKIGRPKKQIADIEIRKSIQKAVSKYFTSKQFFEDCELGKAGTSRMKIHFDLLPYAITKRESIKAVLAGLSEDQLQSLVERIKSELK